MAATRIPRRPIPEDHRLLECAGMMGHLFVGIIGSAGERRAACETSSLESAVRLSDNDLTLRVYQRAIRRRGRCWFCCYIARAESGAL